MQKSSKLKRRVIPGTNESGNDVGLGDDDSNWFIAVEDAVDLVRNPILATRAPERVEEIIWDRISAFVHFSHFY
jgi:hypothetical protein